MQLELLVTHSDSTMLDGRGALVVNAVATHPDLVRTTWDGNDPPSRLAGANLSVPDELESADVTLRIKGADPSEYPVGSKILVTVEPAE